MKVILCAGGTGGHLFPAVALAEEFLKKGHEACIVTDERGEAYCKSIENKEVLKTIRFSPRELFTLIYYAISTAIHFLVKWKNDRPDVLIGFGGIFTIFPILIAKFYGVKVVIYEQNSIVGKANRYLFKLADLRLSMFSIGNEWKVQASPVRKEFCRNVPYKLGKKLKILIIGGSQGAKSFSSIIPEAVKSLTLEERQQIEIIQQESYGDLSELQNKYRQLGVKAQIKKFIYDVADIMESSQLVICRAGASTLAELSAIGRPAILIPYPLAADNHQLLNAKRYSAKNASWIVQEGTFGVEKLKNILKNILKHKELLKRAASNITNDALKNAASDFVHVVEQLKEKK